MSLDPRDNREGDTQESSTEPDETYQPSSSSSSSSTTDPHLITKEELNDLVRDLDLPKDKAEVLGSRLRQWNLLASDVRISEFRSRHKQYDQFYKKENSILFCCDIDGLMTALEICHDSTDWRLFIDSSKVSLKAVLLHNGNVLPSIPVAYTVDTKETYESMQSILEIVQYNRHKWKLCGDFKDTQSFVASYVTGIVEDVMSTMSEENGLKKF